MEKDKKNNKSLVSIIIPTYNRANLIRETLDSILAQTYTNWECIVVDDGSTDGTDKLLAEYVAKDSRCQYHHRPKDRPKGANACRNYGFELSKGEYVNWFDDDDLMLSHKLQEGVKELEKGLPNFMICQSEIYSLKENRTQGLRCQKLVSQNPLDDYIQFKIFWLTGAPLWKKKFLKKNRIYFNEQLYQSQDYDYHIRILALGESYKTSDRIGVVIREHERNMSNSIMDNPKKFLSNVIVRFWVLKNYNHLISNETKYYLFTLLYQYLLKSVNTQDFKTRMKTYLYLIMSLVYFNNSLKSKILASVKWILGTITKKNVYLKPFKVHI
ncbi:glycosyltransferase involved in cell wall biosynthesis [Leeuwenhoekiella aestuarii]|uniref:glycosyltransferase family 2 protein n=1 Tax=Leeuwenhoekiella aestuarii TaxID=2249426 RepID=UPI000FFF4D21|nr:glycosyltransferase family 2 protein [Leeuwenhoekiella aestuarii]RXG13769.1 glycosyltransferase involved in cell wall biosynthesis [Leeuwenhoekiella aestuarii]